MGFHRQPQPSPPPVVLSIGDAAEAELQRLIATHFPPRDPFDVADPCPHNAGGPHQPFPSCGELVCLRCSKVFW